MHYLFHIICFILFSGLMGCDKSETQVYDQDLSKRISVLSYEYRVNPDALLKKHVISLSEPYENKDWKQPGGLPHHSIGHLSLKKEIKKLFDVKFVKKNTKNLKSFASPLVADGLIFGYGSNVKLVAVDANTGSHVWTTSLKKKKTNIEDSFGGGIAYENGYIYAATGAGELLSVEAKTGKIIWRVQNLIPFHTAPTVVQGRIFVTSHDNRIHAYDVKTGNELWSQLAIVEPATVFSATSPAVARDTVVVGMSSGELLALRVDNGLVNWSHNLSRLSVLTPSADLNPVIARPIIDDNVVIAISRSGRLVAINLQSGRRLWMKSISSIETPVISGNYIYVVTLWGQLICLSRDQGQVYWVRQLNSPEEKNKFIQWTAPILGGERLILMSSNKDFEFISPYTGKTLQRTKLKHKVNIAPIIANSTLYILTDKGRLLAYR